MEISVENWLREAFQGNFFNIAVLDETEIQLIPDEGSSEWKTLLNSWDFESSYKGQADFLQKGYELKKRVSIPPDLYYRWELLESRAKEAFITLKQWQNDIDDQHEYIERAYEKEHAGNLSRSGGQLSEIKNSMMSNEGAWTREQFDEIEPLIQRAKQAVIQFFPQWLGTQVIIDPKGLGEFKHQMLRLLGGNLKDMGLDQQYCQLEEHVKKISSQVERLAHIKVVVDEVNVFVSSHRISAATRVAELNNYLATTRNLTKILDEARVIGKIPQLSKAENLLRDFKRSCQAQLSIYQERAQAIWNAKLASLRDVQETSQEVRALITVYDGQKIDIEDFQLMSRLLRVFEDNYYQLASLDLPEKELNAKCKRFVKDAESMLGKDDNIPWDIKKTYELLTKAIRKLRSKNAKEWLAEHLLTPKQISNLDAREANQLRALLHSPPAVLDKMQLKQADKTLEGCNKRLDKLELDGLLVRFQALSREAKISFIEKAKKALGK